MVQSTTAQAEPTASEWNDLTMSRPASGTDCDGSKTVAPGIVTVVAPVLVLALFWLPVPAYAEGSASRASIDRALVSVDQGDFDAALATIEGVRLEQLADPAERADAYFALGAALNRLDEPERARSALQISVRAAQQAGDPFREHAAYAEIASMAARLALFDEAQQQTESAIAAFERLKPEERTPKRMLAFVRTLYNAGSVRLSQDDVDGAERLFRRALTAAEAGGDLNAIANVSIGLGELLSRRGAHAQAIAVLESAERRNASLAPGYERTHLQIGLAIAFRRAGRSADALTAADRAIALANAAEPTPARSLSIAYRERARILTARGAAAQAGEAWERALAELARAFQSENAAALARLEAQFDAEGRDLEIARLGREAAERELALQRQRFALGGGVAALLVVGAFAGLTWRSAQRERRSSTQILSQRADLERAYAERGVLLNEMDHRVRGNLHTIGAIVGLQLRRLKTNEADPAEAASALRDVESRLDTMARLHAALAAVNAVDRVDMGPVLEEIVEHVAGLFATPARVRVDARGVMLSSRLATPIALITCELSANALEHAQLGPEDELSVRLSTEGDEAILEVHDTGRGIDRDRIESSLGLKIVNSLVEPLSGVANVVDANGPPGRPGTLWRVRLPAVHVSVASAA